MPLAPLRFKTAGGAAGDWLEFVEEEGEIVAFELMQGGSAQLKLVKERDE